MVQLVAGLLLWGLHLFQAFLQGCLFLRSCFSQISALRNWGEFKSLCAREAWAFKQWWLSWWADEVPFLPEGFLPAKRPEKVGIVVHGADAEGSCIELAKLLLWCGDAGVGNMAVYDARGNFKQERLRLEKRIKQLQNHRASKGAIEASQSLQPLSVSLTSGPAQVASEPPNGNLCSISSKENGTHHPHQSCNGSHNKQLKSAQSEKSQNRLHVKNNGVLNGVSHGGVQTQRLVVEFLSSEDGKGALVSAAKRLGKQAEDWASRDSEKRKVCVVREIEELDVDAAFLPALSESEVEAALQATGAPSLEPELVLVFGKAFCLAGFPPWLLRNSEIVYMGTLRQVHLGKLLHALLHFAKTTQRFGR